MQQFWNMMWAIWGAKSHALQYVGLAGSLLLLGAGVLAAWRQVHWIAVAGITLAWAFYGPALVATYPQLLERPDHVWKEPWVLLPPILLVGATLVAVRSAWHVAQERPLGQSQQH